MFRNVAFESSSRAEACVTLVTFVVDLALVFFNVAFEVSSLGEACVTLLTSVAALALEFVNVAFETSPLAEACLKFFLIWIIDKCFSTTTKSLQCSQIEVCLQKRT